MNDMIIGNDHTMVIANIKNRSRYKYSIELCKTKDND